MSVIHIQRARSACEQPSSPFAPQFSGTEIVDAFRPHPPRWFPSRAAGMSTRAFTGAFAPAGALTLRSFDVSPESGDMVTCRAHLRIDDREIDREATAYGPIGAMSEILYGLHAGVEIISLYQQQDGAHTASYLQCARDGERCWSFGRGRDGAEATANALISASNQLTVPSLTAG